MTPADRDELAASLRASFGPIIREGDEWRPLADHILALRRAVRQEALESATKVVCVNCKKGVEAVINGMNWQHFVKDGLQAREKPGRWVSCGAAAIRALAAGETP